MIIKWLWLQGWNMDFLIPWNERLDVSMLQIAVLNPPSPLYEFISSKHSPPPPPPHPRDIAHLHLNTHRYPYQTHTHTNKHAHAQYTCQVMYTYTTPIPMCTHWHRQLCTQNVHHAHHKLTTITFKLSWTFWPRRQASYLSSVYGRSHLAAGTACWPWSVTPGWRSNHQGQGSALAPPPANKKTKPHTSQSTVHPKALYRNTEVAQQYGSHSCSHPPWSVHADTYISVDCRLGISPLCPRPSTPFSYCMTPDHPVVAG